MLFNIDSLFLMNQDNTFIVHEIDTASRSVHPIQVTPREVDDNDVLQKMKQFHEDKLSLK